MDRRTVVLSGAALFASGFQAACHPQITPAATGEMIVPSFLGFGSTHLKFEVGAGPNYVDQLGQSVDAVTGELFGHLVEGDRIQTNVSPDAIYRQNSLLYTLTENQSQYNALKSQSAKAKVKAGLFSASGRYDASQSEATSSYAIHICALAKRYGLATAFDPRSMKVAPNKEGHIRRFRRDRPKLLRDLGDSYVHAVTPVSELFIDITYHTSSRQEASTVHAALKAKYGAFGSGKLNFSEMISTGSSAKSIEIVMYGLDATGVPKTQSAEEAQAALEAFFKDDNRPQFAELTYRRVANLNSDKIDLDWVDPEELNQRLRFVNAAAEYIQYLQDVITDAQFVKTYPEEFDVKTKTRAENDISKASTKQNEIAARVQDSVASFRARGKNHSPPNRDGRSTNYFDLSLLNATSKEFQFYERIPPAVAETPADGPQEAPASAPRPAPSWTRGNDGPRH